MNDVIVLRKEVYGRELFYPVNEFACILCRLLGKKSMSMDHIKVCLDAKWKITIHEKQKKEVA